MRLKLAGMLLITLTLFSGGWMMSLLCRQTPVVFVDVNALKGRLIRQLAERELSETQSKAVIARMRDALPRALAQYAREHHVIVLEREALLAGGQSVTDEVAHLLAAAMREQP